MQRSKLPFPQTETYFFRPSTNFAAVSKFPNTSSAMSRHSPPAGALASFTQTLAADASMKPPPQRPIVLADLNVDPPDSENYAFASSASPSLPISRIALDETVVEKPAFMAKDADALDMETSSSKKVGRSRTKNIKVEFLPDSVGADTDADQSGQGVTTREEKVSSLKTGLVHVARKMTKNMHAHFILGLMYQRMGQPQKAILAYEKAVEILLRSEEEIDRPDLLSVVQLHHAQCILLESLENSSSDKELEPHELDEICSKLRESIESDVRQASVWNTLGLILLRTGRLQSAISVFSSLLEIVPDYLDGLGNLGIAYLQGGDLELSEKYLQDLILKDQNHPAALVNYAALLLIKYGSVIAGAGANADAQTSMDHVSAVCIAKDCLLAGAQSDPRAAHIWTNLANAYNLIGDHRTSGKCLEKAGKLDPNCLATRFAVGVHRIRDAERSQNPNEQLTWAGNEMASVIREGDPVHIEPPIAWAGLALVHKAQHEIASVFEIDPRELLEVKDRAMSSLKQAIGEDPDDALQWNQIGLHCLCTQQLKMSQTYFKSAVTRLNDCVYTWSNLGISLQLLEESTHAEEVYKHALSLATSQQAPAIFSNLGNFCRQMRRYESAKAMFSKALELRPGYAPAYNNLGLVFIAEGQLEEAKFCFNKATESDPFLDAAKSNMIKVATLYRKDVSLHSA
ncbi:probable UDP-N-acetylglucosamine--peptide N-acetylglucosaminyltransferase SPINDLY isoform X1 [Salvia hispanica]|uniref:probable UDP-N-acetylglucosamine--peptide N-acetylglucosaminyltransferase SPINDLY isoform X1 n=1 Tax=Salvia hispanica TaxID=49212 RepID=UPI00200937A0|nr:probable UDP-N-acetylglucosamine--peptide N-acetylglucosaminyltransferase SPINDLY isoform X1 [Salvia hispanica]